MASEKSRRIPPGSEVATRRLLIYSDGGLNLQVRLVS